MTATPSFDLVTGLWRRRSHAAEEKPQERFALRMESLAETTVVHVEGRLTVERSEELKKTLKRAKAEPAGRTVVNLADCPFVDSAGLAALVSGLQEAAKTGRGFALAGLSPQLWSLLRMARLDKSFEIADAVQGIRT